MQQPPSSSSPPVSTNPAHDAARTLQAYHWDLMAAVDGQGQRPRWWPAEGRSPLRLNFDGQRLSVLNLCNVVGADYILNGSRLQISRPMSTLPGCTDGFRTWQEQRVKVALTQAQRIDVQAGTTAAPRLTVHFADGSRWELAGAPTAATRYGSAGDRIFLEVAPERVTCNHPLMPNAQCLRVRDVRFADNGVRQGTGEWRIFQGEIEGYQHERSIRNVVRVQRYPLARNGQLPADAPSHAYVLDMVVESERMR